MLGLDQEALTACECFIAEFGVDDQLLQTALSLRGRVGLYDRVSEGGAESISLCMIVKDEQSNLAACLASAKPAVHELVVVDTGSSDHTADIATVFGARVLAFPWNGSFSDARNIGIDTAKATWILSLDADEVLAAQDYPVIANTTKVSSGTKIAWSVLTRNYTTKVHAQGWTANDGAYPLQEKAEGWHPSWKVRLFPNLKEIRFKGDVHEMVEEALRTQRYEIRQAPFVVHHYGGLQEDDQRVRSKRQRYFEIGMKKLEQNPSDMVAVCELAVQAGELGLFEQGSMLWDRVLAVDPEMVEALFNKGYCLMGLKRYAEGLELAHRVLLLQQDHKEAAFNYGTCELYAGDPQRGLTVLGAIAQKHLDYPPLSAILTVLALCVGDLVQARQSMEALTSRNYAIIDYIRERIAKLQELGQHAAANQIVVQAGNAGLQL
jgi:tetratricopeptide (TPR) repeat protein